MGFFKEKLYFSSSTSISNWKFFISPFSLFFSILSSPLVIVWFGPLILKEVACHVSYLTCDWLICVQVVRVHQSTVDTYLEDIIMGAIDKTAEEQVSLGCLSGSKVYSLS